ncbi:MAG: alpha/beta hydrolase [Clostridiales bacterium]|nr:alpha/beta hydrolase [Clostridiales bacterium]
MNNIAKGALIGAGAAAGAGAIWLCADGIKYFREAIVRDENSKLVNLSEHSEEKLCRYARINDEERAWLSGMELSEMEIRSIDGLKLRGHYLASRKPSNRYVILFHGYRGSALRKMAVYARFYHELGYNILFPDARAHGESEGKYIGYGVLDKFDCLRWVEYTNGTYGSDISIILHGCSMGASTVLMASDLFSKLDNVKAIIADSGYTGAWEALEYVLNRRYGKKAFPTLYTADMLCKAVAGYSFKDCTAPEALRETEIPVLFIHGSEDVLVPVEMTYENYEACRSGKELYIAEGAGHIEAYYEQKQEYEKRVKTFLKKYAK